MALTHFLVIVLLVLGAPLLLFPCAEASEVGVSYGRIADDLPDPEAVVQLLQDNGITMVRLYDADPEVLSALANTGIKVIVMMPNEEVAAAAENPSYALQWLQCNVSDYYPDTLINGVAIGNEVFELKQPDLNRKLVSAMTNVHAALVQLGLADDIKVSTPIAFTAFRNTFPPSDSRFQDDIAQSVMKPMLQFLRRTGSYLSVNPYPFFAYADNPKDIPLDYALGYNKTGVVDQNTGLRYHSLLDAMMDATFYAMENLTGHINTMQSGGTNGGDTKWSESGWPSNGQIKPGKKSMPDGGSLLEASDGFQPATVANAQAYNNYVINRVLSGKTGTPYRPNADMDIYIFALFNENQKGQGPDDVEQYFGLFCPDMEKVYEFDFRGGAGSDVHQP
ncbi:hypothetical protein QOZ80_7BG0602510 [Eleusine coracana subsp. coracana]|nr:hypothetical protein QOZ80_7BG0602510 [Eleusine coracana subsp. coracana]